MKRVGSYAITDDEKKVVITDIMPHVAIRLKNLFPQIRKANRPPIIFTLSPQVAEDFEWFTMRYPMEAEGRHAEILARVAENSRNRSIQVEQAFSGLVPVEAQLNGTLREYQKQAVAGFLASQRLLCGDAVGLGKTIVAIGALVDPRLRPGLVVVQSHLVKQWMEQITKWTGLVAREIKTTNPAKEKVKPADIYVTTYHRLAGWVDPLSSGMVKSVTFDECQELRREESQRYDAAKGISEKCEWVLGLSATPVYNYGIEIFNIMDCIAPFALGTREEFLREWCSEGDFHGKVKDPQALGSYLREKHLFLRRTRREVGKELKPVNKIVHTVPYDEREQDKILDVAARLARKTLTGAFTERGQAAREFDLMLRMATGVSKAKFVADYVRILLEAGERVLLAGWHRDVYEIWLKELADYKPVMYTGSESATQKEAAKRAMLTGDSNLMVISLRSGVGLDGLQKVCSTVVFGELDWSPQVHDQVIGRIDRDGQEEEVTSIFLVSDGGSDPPMVDLLGLKGEQARGIVDPLASQETQYSDEGRIKIMARKFLEQKGIKLDEQQ